MSILIIVTNYIFTLMGTLTETSCCLFDISESCLKYRAMSKYKNVVVLATPEAFAENPSHVHQFYNLRRAQLNEVEPNQGHIALAEFESSFDGEFLIVTQNVDDLHERAGSKNVIHIHGELRKARCTKTGKIYEWASDLTTQTPNPDTNLPGGTLRPHICWFGEVPFFMNEIMHAVSKADMFVAIGTSGVVYPAAGLVSMAPESCDKVLINMDSSENVSAFDKQVIGPASKKVSEFFESVPL